MDARKEVQRMTWEGADAQAAKIERLKGELQEYQGMDAYADEMEQRAINAEARVAELTAALSGFTPVLLADEEAQYWNNEGEPTPKTLRIIKRAQKALSSDGTAAAKVLEASDRLERLMVDCAVGQEKSQEDLDAEAALWSAVRAYQQEQT